MPDAFFASSKPRKRKRSTNDALTGSSKKIARKIQPNGKSSSARSGSIRQKSRAVDEELDSDHTNEEDDGVDDLDLRASDAEEKSGDEDENETPAEKRLRLAKMYLETVKEGLADGDFDAAEIDKELISARLKQDVLEHSGKMHLFVADSFDFTVPQATLRTRGHRLSITSAVASESGYYLFTAGKEGSIIKWDLSTGAKLSAFHRLRPPPKHGKGKQKGPDVVEVKGHTDEVLALALSGDGNYLASAGKDRRVCVWDIEKGEWVKGFGGHKDLISALSFRKGTNQLYTASHDRTLKLYDLTPSVFGYVETLFGHQDAVLGLDSLKAETAVSVGGRDKTLRFWKIVDESQLVFRGGGRSRVREILEGDFGGIDEGMEKEGGRGTKGDEKKYVEGSMECVAMIDETNFVSGGDSGSISLWTTQKKKPVFTQPLSHGLNEVQSSTEGVVETPRWVTSLACLRYSDLFASGSWDGAIRLWKLAPTLKSFSLIGSIPVPGVINCLQFVSSSRSFNWASSSATDYDDLPNALPPNKKVAKSTTLLIAGLGQEHRLGRWLKVKQGGAVNGAIVVALRPR